MPSCAACGTRAAVECSQRIAASVSAPHTRTATMRFTRRFGVAAAATVVALLAVTTHVAALHSTPTSPTYRVASVQYAPKYVPPFFEGSTQLTIAENLVEMGKVVANASASKADLVVFPEGGTGYFLANLNGTRANMAGFCETLPAVSNGMPVVVPCTDPAYKSRGQLQQPSCAAQKGSIVVVVNMCDLQPCTPGSGSGSAQGECPSDGMYLYDTTVVFSETGQILAKYWKYNLFSGDFLFNRLEAPVPTTFLSTFGVRFGFFICFDLIYRDPSVAVLSSVPGEAVTDVLFSTFWINNGVFNAPMVQQGYSRAYGVNFIASNVAFCPKNCGGGVYHKGQPLSVLWNSGSWQGTHIVYADVPKISGSSTAHSPAASGGLRGASVLAAQATPALWPMRRRLAAVGNTTDCGFGPGSCNMFVPTAHLSGSLTARGANGLVCEAQFAVGQSAALANETWALQALDINQTIKDSPSIENQTSCLLLRCELRVDSRGHHYCHVPQNWQPSTTVFTSLSLTLSGLHDDCEILPILTVDDGRVVDANALAVTSAVTGSDWASPPTYTVALTDQAPNEPLFLFGAQAFRAPLHV